MRFLRCNLLAHRSESYGHSINTGIGFPCLEPHHLVNVRLHLAVTAEQFAKHRRDDLQQLRPARKDLLSHPKSGASWEGYALEELLKVADVEEFYFWGTHGGAELDLLLVVNGRQIGVEFKRVDAPKLTRSIHIALDDLGLDHLAVIYPEDMIYPLEERVTVLPVTALARGGAMTQLLRCRGRPKAPAARRKK